MSSDLGLNFTKYCQNFKCCDPPFSAFRSFSWHFSYISPSLTSELRFSSFKVKGGMSKSGREGWRTATKKEQASKWLDPVKSTILET